MKNLERKEHKMLTETEIRAVEYLPETNENDIFDSFQLSQSDGLLLNLFGDMPDYSNEQYEVLWQEIFDAEDEDIIAYCLEKGIDVLDDNGEPVSGWRDIAVMLKAIDSGIVISIKKCNFK